MSLNFSGLNDGSELSPEWVMQMARSFRERAALLLQQAELLERMAVSCEEGDQYAPEFAPLASLERLEDRLRRRNVVTCVSDSYNLMLETHHKLDNIESRLVPQGERNKARNCPKQSKKTAFSIFLTENYESLAESAGDRNALIVMKEASKRWRELCPSDQQKYKTKSANTSKKRGVSDMQSQSRKQRRLNGDEKVGDDE